MFIDDSTKLIYKKHTLISDPGLDWSLQNSPSCINRGYWTLGI